MCPQNQKILSTNYHYGNPSTRFSVEPKNGGYIFAAKEPKKLLKLMQDYVPKENFVKPRPMFKRISGWFKH
ncbi:DUF956 family protein [Limosilactobacillus fermentum]|uniref:DUF956 family protein n=1 Tax=Limosilactobacillus fermentum TaxID=1613 RepID=UPI0021A774FA|nr:DUF956 family protein [Limosilactobacillus fermentum]